MSLALKYIVPLISKNLKLEYITEDDTFEGVYTFNLSTPCLMDHIFLMFKLNRTNHKQFERHQKLKNDPCLHSWGQFKINGEYHTIYTFPIMNGTINNIRKGKMIVTNPNDIIKITSFWKGTDPDINRWTIYRLKMPSITWNEIIIPEKDEETKKGGRFE